ncbi:MAG TPA: HepT-like ribonuclease domain-containing protein [Oscillatoriaceae cyanobacterium]
MLAGRRQERVPCEASELVRSAVLQKLMVIGEATARLSAELKDAHPEIPWRSIVGFRNIAVHAYFSVNWEIVWTAATVESPALAREIELIQESF